MVEQIALSNRGAVLFVVGLAAFFLVLWWFLRWLYVDRQIFTRLGRRVAGYYEAPRSRKYRDVLETWFPRAWPFIEGRFDPRHFQGLPLTLLILAGAYTAFLFVGLVEEVMESEEVVAVDEFFTSLVAPLRNPILTRVLSGLTQLGSTATLAAVAIVSTGFLWVRGPVWGIPALWITVVGSQVTTWSGKFLIDRPRPEFILDVTAASPSFPSGHATGAMAVYGILAYVLSRDLPNRRRRFDLIYWICALIAIIALSRIYLSVHYPSDVGAGLLVGGFWVLAGMVVAESLRDKSDS